MDQQIVNLIRGKQNRLISGENIKKVLIKDTEGNTQTISLLGSGTIDLVNGGGGGPSQYIKTATSSNGVLTLVNQNNEETKFGLGLKDESLGLIEEEI